MYDIYDDELKEMYESKESSGDTLDKGISPKDPLSALIQEKFIVLNEQVTLREAINIIEEDSYKLKAIIDGEVDKRYLTPIRMRILNQKNKLIELDDLMRKVLIKKQISSIN